MAQVIELQPGCNPQIPDEAVVEMLQDLIERAKAGELRSIAYAATTKTDTCTGWTGGAGTRHSLGTGIRVLERRYIMAIMGEDD